MSKNTNSTQFRSVDVDVYDEDQYEDESRDDLSANQAVSDRADQVKQLLMGMKTKEALKVSLQNPPLGNKDEKILERNFETVLSVLKSFKAAEIQGAIDDLDAVEVDVLMKYLYKGFKLHPDKSGILLAWHDKAFKTGGLGSIVRVMVDRKGI